MKIRKKENKSMAFLIIDAFWIIKEYPNIHIELK
jgi:hypothetical protein